MERMCWWWIVVPGRWWWRCCCCCCCGGGDDGVDDGVDDALGEWSGGWSWTMMAWPRPFDSADITYASAPSHQTTRTTSLDCLFGRGWYAKAEHRARELHQAMTFVILQYCYSLALFQPSMSAINKTSHNPRFQFQGHPIPSHKNPLKKPKRVCPMARLIAFLPLPRASRCRLHDRPADSGRSATFGGANHSSVPAISLRACGE